MRGGVASNLNNTPFLHDDRLLTVAIPAAVRENPTDRVSDPLKLTAPNRCSSTRERIDQQVAEAVAESLPEPALQIQSCFVALQYEGRQTTGHGDKQQLPKRP